MKSIYLLSMAVLALFAGQAAAQMTRPTYGPDQAKLSFLVGQYTTTSTITMRDNTTTSTGFVKTHWGLDSMFVFVSSEESNPNMGSYKGFGVLGYDSRNDDYALTMFNSFGFRTEFKGQFSGDTLTLKSQIETPRGTFNQKMVWFKEGQKLRMLVYGDFGEGYSLMVDETATPATAVETKKAEK